MERQRRLHGYFIVNLFKKYQAVTRDNKHHWHLVILGSKHLFICKLIAH